MRKRQPAIFPIVVRILLLNVLIVFLPVAAFLFLDTYEEQLLDQLERGLVQQGRLLAGSLSVIASRDAKHDAGREKDYEIDGSDPGTLYPGTDFVASDLEREAALDLIRSLAGQHQSRLRVIALDGELLADSSTIDLGEDAESTATAELPDGQPAPAVGGQVTAEDEAPEIDNPRESMLYRIASSPVRLLRRLAGSPERPLASADFYTEHSYLEGEEIRAAFDGHYGATTRVSVGGQISVTLYSALPVVLDGVVRGAVLVSQSTFRILQDIYRLRTDVFTIFLVCLGVAIVLSIFISLTIARPISQLSRRALEAVDERGRLRGPIPPSRRRDEIGRLSRAMSELTQQIDQYTRRLESFAAEASHELKNPLASIGASCEMAMDATDEKTRNQFLDQARQDVHRAEMIITAMRDLSRIDARTDPPATCDALQVVRDAVEARRSSDTRHTYLLEADAAEALAPGQLTVGLGCHRLRQAVENLLENAAGFSPEGSTVRVAISLLDQRPTGRESDARGTEGGPRVQIVVDDEGPGLGDDASRVFERFYTTRPSEAGHLGLGLAIVRALCERAGGTVKAGNAGGPGDEARSGSEQRTGARMTIDLPRSTPPDAADRPLVV